ncbi:MAG: hypothetical protein ACTSYU_12760 [Promethearchaeota archaeon]
MVVSPPPKNSPLKLLFQFPLKISAKLKTVMTELMNQSAEILTVDHDSGLILIPPSGAALYIAAPDLGTSKKTAQLQSRIEEFFIHHVWGVIILEGFHRWGDKKRNSIQKMMLSIFLSQTDSACPILMPSRNAGDSAEILMRIAKREQIEDLHPILSRPRAKTVLLSKAQEYLIEGLLNCGSKKAKKLLTEFDSPNAIIWAILENPEKFDDIKGFGKKFVKDNSKLLGHFLLSPQNPQNEEKNNVKNEEIQ